MLRRFQQAMAAAVFALIAAVWIAATPFRHAPGTAPAPSGPEVDPERAVVLGVALGILALVCLGLAVGYGPRFVRQVLQALRAKPGPPKRPRKALVAHFLFALFLAYFLEAGVGGSLRPPPALTLDGVAYRLAPGEVVLASSSAGKALRKTEGGWSKDAGLKAVEAIVVPDLSEKLILQWGLGSAELRSSGDVEVTVDGLQRTVRNGEPLELSSGAVIIIGELRGTLVGPTWRVLIALTAFGKTISLLAIIAFVFILGGRELFAELGWTRVGWKDELKRGVLALLAFLPLYVLLNLLTQLLARVFEVPVESHPMIQAVLEDGLTLIPMVAVGAVILAPIQEELLFRGFFQQSTQLVSGPLAALLLSSVAFGLIHVGFANLLPLSGVGLLFGALRLSSPQGSLVGATVAHALFNGLMLTVLVAATV